MFKTLGKNTEKSIIQGNPSSETAIITLWTMKEAVEKKVKREDFAVIGQLYNAERGIDLLVRNLLANPQIKLIVITGSDLSKSGIVLKDFFDNGFEKGKTKSTERECWKIKSKHDGFIGLDVDEKDLETLRKSITCLRVDDIEKWDKKSMKVPSQDREKVIYEKKEEDFGEYVTEENAFVLRSEKVVESWLKILDLILRFGRTTDNPDGSKVKELINLVSVITDEDPNDLYLPEAFPYDLDTIKEYTKTITTDFKPKDVSYTYGMRIRSHFGHDQIDKVVSKLKKNINERQAVISLWDPREDIDSKMPPCLNHIWVRVRNDTLFMTSTFRSNDMFLAYPQNVMALRQLQEIIRKDLVKAIGKTIALGDLIINSESAHLYENTWESCKDILEKYYSEYVETNPAEEYDPRGNFVVSIENGKIKVDYTSANGEHLKTFEGSNAFMLRKQIFREGIISNPAHGFYLGMELVKAEIALKQSKLYKQDQPFK